MNVLIIGKEGMLAREMIRVLKADPAITLTVASRTQGAYQGNHIVFDILKDQHNFVGFDAIVNCAGLIKPQINERDVNSTGQAFIINSLFPRSLKKYCEAGTKVLQIATDCIFDGKTVLPYRENASFTATDVYGLTKAFGEVSCPNFYNLRCSIIGRETYKRSLVEWAIQQAGTTVNGYLNHTWNGLTVTAFSKIILGILKDPEQKLFLSGLNELHIVPKNTVTKARLLEILSNRLNLNLTINQVNAPGAANRELATSNKPLVDSLWVDAGYPIPPTIAEMCYADLGPPIS